MRYAIGVWDMMNSYFQTEVVLNEMLKKAQERRIIRNGFAFPLGIIPSASYIPSEGYTQEFIPSSAENEHGDLYSYTVNLSAEKLCDFLQDAFLLFGPFATLRLERWSEDINRERDVFYSAELELSRAVNVFERYKELWLECGFVGFGMNDPDSGLQVFVSDHKVLSLSLPSKLREEGENLIEKYGLEFDDMLEFSFNYEHWHQSLFGIISDNSSDESIENEFDYYDIVNELKRPLDLLLIHDDIEEISTRPKWWYVVVKGIMDNGLKSFAQSYYLVADTSEVMETVIADEMEKNKSSSYYIFDFCNVNPQQIEKAFNREGEFSKTDCGIWIRSELLLMPNDKQSIRI